MDKIQLVLESLKPKVKALGFNKKELQGIASQIANNLNADDEISEDELSAQVNTQIDAILPYLQFAQSQANRVIDSWKRTNNKEAEESEEKEIEQPKVKTEGSEMAKAMKDLLSVVSGLKEEVKTLKGANLHDKRTQRLEAIIKDTGSFGKMTMKQFSRMKFDTEEDFDEFIQEVENDLKSFNQERADAGLSKLGAVGAPDKKKEKEDEPYSEAELKELAKF